MSSIKMNEGFSEANALCASIPDVPKKPTAIAELIQNCGLSYREIEARSGGKIKFNTISGFVSSAKPNPELDTMLALAKGTGIPFLTIAAAFAGIRQGQLSLTSAYLEEILAEYESLSETERQQFAGTIELLAQGIHRAKLPTR